MRITDFTDLSSLLDLLLDVVCIVDREGRFLFVSASCERVFGYTRDEMVGKFINDLVHPDDLARTLQVAGEIMGGTPRPIFENRYIHKNGSVVNVMWSARFAEDNQLRVAIARDVTGIKRADAMRAALYAISEAAHAAVNLDALFQQIHSVIGGFLTAANFFVALHDRDEDQLTFPYFVDEFDAPPEPQPLSSGTLSGEVISTGKSLLLTPSTRATLSMHLREPVGREATAWLGVPLVTQNGITGALVVQSYSDGVRYSEADQELLQFVSTQVASAIERKQMQARLEYNANYDHLTGLPNRQLFHDRLSTALARARRNNMHFALLYLDLDRFKEINDTFGHAVGDRMLESLGKRLLGCVREADTVCRIGGDEFVVLLENISLPEHGMLAARKVLEALSLPMALDSNVHLISPSIGLALYPWHGTEARQLLGQADRAMYCAKRSGGNCIEMAVAADA